MGLIPTVCEETNTKKMDPTAIAHGPSYVHHYMSSANNYYRYQTATNIMDSIPEDHS